MNDINLDLFEKYFQNQLSHVEKTELENKLLVSEEFKNEFETYKILHAGIRANVLNEKLGMLKKHAATAPSPSPEPGMKTSWRSYAIYGILLLSLIGMIIYLSTNKEQQQNTSEPILDDTKQSPTKQPSINLDTITKDKLVPEPQKVSPEQIKEFPKSSKKEIFAQKESKNYAKEALSMYKAPSNFAVIWRDTETSKDKIYADAVKMFENKKYQDAVNILKDLDDEKSAYLLAHCLLLFGKSTDAANIFRNMADNDFSTYYQEAKWYLAISLLANYPNTKTELDEVIKSLKGNPDKQKLLNILESKIQ
jgi:hypothetical protein